jgi:hypothetical protein
MKNYLLKEFKLAAHPTTYIFMILPLMLIIPNYPYTVTYFYFTLAVFFTCMLGRECHDIQYTMMLPVAKSDIVKGRMLFVVILEIISLVLSIPIVIIRQTVMTAPNLGGCDANLAIFGFGLLLYSIFNLVFFLMYYKNVQKPGVAFIFASMFQLLYVIVLEVLDHTIPLFTEVLDTRDTVHITEKIIFDLISIAVFALVTFFTYKKSIKSFTELDL